jgi:hypothetical protein
MASFRNQYDSENIQRAMKLLRELDEQGKVLKP